jgi:double-stranded uracil-DNA glycosylase
MPQIVSSVQKAIPLDRLPPLRDRVKPPVRVLFVGINPGVRSAQTGHHFAGYSNRFWKLLYEARIVPEPITYQDDERLPQWGLGITNLIARATPGINTLEPAEYVAGVSILRRKVRRWHPEVVAFVGVTVFRAAFACPAGTAVKLGLHRDRFEGARVVVLPNPSGRNAHFSYKKMVKAFRALRRIVC